MKPEILEIQPQELKFPFELKKQSSCSVQMTNKTNHHVAFKIKTTNPKKYCVRPNTGVIDPNSVCDFTVTMQAPKAAPPDMICRDKFLLQSTFVPQGTNEEDVTSNMFVKEDGKTVDEKRLKVILVPTPESPPINNESRELKDEIVQKNSSHVMVDEGIEVVNKSLEATQKEESTKRSEESVKRKEEFVKENKKEFMQMNDTEVSVLVKDVEEMKLKVKALESNLNEAKATILHLTEGKRSATQENHFLQGELDMLRSKRQRAQVGFPLLFVFMVALVSLYLGYMLHR